MRDLFRAEWLKISGNRLLTLLLVWIFPVAALLISGFAVFLLQVSDDFRLTQMSFGVDPWDRTLVQAWGLVNNEIVRYVIVAYTAVVFAGEYQHGTWKNLTTRRQRTTLMAVKFITVALVIMLAFTLMTLIIGVSSGLAAASLDLSYGAVTGERLGTFLGDYAAQMVITLLMTLIACGYAALVAMSSRSVVVSVVGGVVLVLFEQISLVWFSLIDSLLGTSLVPLYRFTPGYTLSNISTWLLQGEAYRPFGMGERTVVVFAPVTLAASLLVMALWLLLLVGGAIWRFRSQDISS